MENLLNLLDAFVLQVDEHGGVVPLSPAARVLLASLDRARGTTEQLFQAGNYAELKERTEGVFVVPTSAGEQPIKWTFERLPEGGILAAGIGWVSTNDLVERLTRQTLLYKEQVLNLLPRNVFDELLQRKAVQPKAYRDCTIMFADVVDFTQISLHLDPVSLIRKLDEHFSAFDDTIQQFGMVKIKTLTDSYIAASGVPHRSRGHAVSAALAALKLQSSVAARTRKRPDRVISGCNVDHWKVRIGMHSGPCISGLIGSSRLLFDVWGEAIDQAWRLQEVGGPGQITISGATLLLVAPYFLTSHVTRLAVPHRDPLEVHLLHRLREEYSEDDEGTTPNREFRLRFIKDFVEDAPPESVIAAPLPFLEDKV